MKLTSNQQKIFDETCTHVHLQTIPSPMISLQKVKFFYRSLNFGSLLRDYVQFHHIWGGFRNHRPNAYVKSALVGTKQKQRLFKQRRKGHG